MFDGHAPCSTASRTHDDPEPAMSDDRTKRPNESRFDDLPSDALDRPAPDPSERVSFVVRLPNGRRLVREARAMTLTEEEFLAALK